MKPIVSTNILMKLNHVCPNHVKVKVKSCPTLCDPMDCNLPCSSVHGIFQARVLEGLTFPSLEDLPDPGIKPEFPTM